MGAGDGVGWGGREGVQGSDSGSHGLNDSSVKWVVGG